MGDVVVQNFCLLLEYSSTTIESTMVAEANLHPEKLDLNKHDHNINDWLSYVCDNARDIIGSGGRIGDLLFIHMHTALERSHTRQFRLQLMQSAANWRKQNGEEQDWSIM